MDLAIIYIGTSQSIFAAILMLIKRPLNIADKILGAWLSTIACMFILNIIKINASISEDFWPISVNISLTFPLFLYLYSKYITRKHTKFNRYDFLHFLPSVIGVIIISFYFDSQINDLISFVNHYHNLALPQTIIANIYYLVLWIYTIGAFVNIYRYKRQINNLYSFESYKINLSWFLLVVISNFLILNFILIISIFHYRIEFLEHIEIFRSGSLLFFVYVLSFWGFKQQQLISSSSSISLNINTKLKESNPERYQKSGLKDKQAEIYLQNLINYMNHSEAWKDPELSIAKLSEETDTPKHYVTQVLNEHLQKNFYTFVNEYRTENAKKLILSPEYENWSFIAVAYECGFNSKTAFNNFFKKHTNMTPTEFKNSKIPSKE